MIWWEVARHQVAISGRVTDAQRNQPIGDAEVVITEMPATFKEKLKGALKRFANGAAPQGAGLGRTRTRPDGLFYFLDLPDGKYTLAAAAPRFGKRYGVVRQTTVVARDDSGALKPSFVAFPLQPTAVSGKITATGQKAGVVMAEVRVKGSGERAFSDARGQYWLAGIEPGNRTVVIVAQGYRSASQAITIKEPGEVQTVNVTLARET